MATIVFIPSPANGVVGHYFQWFAVAQNVTGTARWSGTGLPPGLQVISSLGEIRGTPTTTGQYTVSLTVEDDGTQSQTRNFTFHIHAAISNTSSVFHTNVTTDHPGIVWKDSNISITSTAGDSEILRSEFRTLASDFTLDGYYTGLTPAYVALISFQNDGRMRFRLAQESIVTQEESIIRGPELIDYAEMNLGLAIRVHDGTVYKWTFNELTQSDDEEPYTFSAASVTAAGPTNNSTLRNTIATSQEIGYIEMVLIDIPLDSVDWDNLTVVSHTLPGKPARPALTNLGAREVRGTWSAPSQGGSSISGYDLRTMTSGFQWDYIRGVTSSPHTFFLTQEDITYDVQVRARNDGGAGPWSDSRSITTIGDTLVAAAEPSVFAANVNANTPGVVWLGTTGNAPAESQAWNFGAVMVGNNANGFQINQQVDAGYVTSSPAYISNLFFRRNGDLQMHLLNEYPGSGSSTDVGFNDAGQNLGLAIRLSGGEEYKWELDTLLDSDANEPYRFLASSVAAAGQTYDQSFIDTMYGSTSAQYILVDRTHDNINWANLEIGTEARVDSEELTIWEIGDLTPFNPERQGWYRVLADPREATDFPATSANHGRALLRLVGGNSSGIITHVGEWNTYGDFEGGKQRFTDLGGVLIQSEMSFRMDAVAFQNIALPPMRLIFLPTDGARKLSVTGTIADSDEIVDDGIGETSMIEFNAGGSLRVPTAEGQWLYVEPGAGDKNWIVPVFTDRQRGDHGGEWQFEAFYRPRYLTL